MGWEAISGLRRLANLPWQHTDASLAADLLYIIGAGGDVNPGARHAADTGNWLIDPVVKNHGAVGLEISTDPVTLGCLSQFVTLVPGAEHQFLGTCAQLGIRNSSASTACAWDVDAQLSRRPNTLAAGGVAIYPELGGIITAVPGGASSLVIEAPWDLTITHLYVYPYPGTVPASALGTYLLTALDDAAHSLLTGASFDLETLTLATREDVGLTATVAHLDIDEGEHINLAATSSNADLTNGDLLVLVAATRR